MPNFTKSASELFDCYSLQLVCHNVPFTLLNITDNSVVINKLRQDNSGQALKESVSVDSEVPDIMFICSTVDYGIHTYIEAVRYIFIFKICFCVLWYKLQTCVVKLKLRTIFLCLFLVCSRNWCFYNYYYFKCFILLQGHQGECHICFFFFFFFFFFFSDNGIYL